MMYLVKGYAQHCNLFFFFFTYIAFSNGLVHQFCPLELYYNLGPKEANERVTSGPRFFVLSGCRCMRGYYCNTHTYGVLKQL